MNTNRRFLNYKEYDNFQRDLNDGKISEDSIVFIQDKHCIWARGEEYAGNLTLDYDKDTKIATLKTADGESIVDFVDKDEYTGFKSQFINFVNAEYLPFKNNVYTQFTITTQNALSELDNRVDGLRQQLETVSANIPAVPTNVSAFTNDAGYLTSADIEGIGNVDERQLNAKLKTLQEYFADQYVLKKDVQTPGANMWSEATIYPFGELPESEIGETPMHTSIEACREDVYNQLKRDGAIRNDICYFIYKES